MKQKQFKIGEKLKDLVINGGLKNQYALGGIIEVKIQGRLIMIQCKNSFTGECVEQAGSSASVTTDELDLKFKLDMFLNDMTSSYHAEKIIEWIDENSNKAISNSKSSRW
jgi:hypothetical protein